MKKIFLSYSRENSDVADILDYMFKIKNINLIRDIRDIKYKDSIKQFMKKIRDADYCLIIISKDYLISANCMYEVTEFLKDKNYIDKILPLVHKNTDIFLPDGKNFYLKFWQNKYKQMKEELKDLDDKNKIGTITELNRIEEIQRNITEFMAAISDMNSVIFDDNITIENFDQIYSVIEVGYYLLNVPQTLYYNNVMIWWKKDSKGYTDDLREARIFTKEEVAEKMKGIYSTKKFAAIPINQVAAKFEQSVVPYIEKYIDIILQNHDFVIGNKNIFLNKEEKEWIT